MAKSLDRTLKQMQDTIDAILRYHIDTLTFEGLSERRIAKKMGVPRWVVRKLSSYAI